MLELIPRDFLILLANFLGLLIALNYILFKPMLKLFKEREDNISGALGSAKEMFQKKDEAIARLNKDLADARDKAKEAFETLRAEGGNRQRELFSGAETEASGMLQKARTELRAEAEKARQALRADVDKFSDEIVRKLLKA
ncbi:MAG: ATP synthase F0 subunit B [Nitrospirae bacterium]|nr:ATP synthase F0 subunit B [Nitrospirota bacterium]MBI3377533.1 ATP synthase F0 subunit B [Nitrospirota bacterium]